ncbi:MAG: hypothetical protein WKF86_07495 [Acidimicrobiales bacterium]
MEALNSELVEAGYGPIAERTFTHYKSLLEAGFNRYVSINRFDVARAAAAYENASARGRYAYVEADLGVRVIFAKANKLVETFGRATEVGEVGAMLRFEEPEVIDGLRQLKPQPGDMVTVRYLEAGRTAGGRVVEADVKATPVTIEIEFAQLLSIASLEGGTPLPMVDVRFVLISADADDQTVDVMGRRLHHFFELVEGLRAVSNRAGAQQPDPVYAEPPVLRSLMVASPPDLIIAIAEQVTALIPWALIGGALKTVAAFPEKRKQWYEGTAQKLTNQLKQHDLREKELALEQKKLEVAQAEQEANLRTAVLVQIRSAFPLSDLSDAEALQHIDEFVVPSLRALGRAGVEGIAPPADDKGSAE